MSVLNVGRDAPFTSGTGVCTGWGDYDEDRDPAVSQHIKAKWGPDRRGRVCCECGKPLEHADVSRYFFYHLWRCEDGHKFHYINTG